ncbi:MAG: nitroreductase family protein [Thermoguttaceae bacterium]|jgi:ferredoxin|nr:nitroreductase family protein [Thermoguttaceae bacterium]
MLNFIVKDEKCTRCGLCVLDCPTRIIQQQGDQLPFILPENEENCLQCQHCLAVCPTAAISIFSLNPDESLPVSPDVWPRFEQMVHLARGRRSVRQYRDENVDSELIGRLLTTVAHAPTAVNNRMLTFTVIDDRGTLGRFREKVMGALLDAAEAGFIPERCAYVAKAASAYVEHGADVIFRGAPHVLIVSAPPQSAWATEDVPLALAYFELLAQSAGLGTVWCGLLKLALEAVPGLKGLIDLPPDHHYFAMLFGYPAVQYARTAQRDGAAKIKWFPARKTSSS